MDLLVFNNPLIEALPQSNVFIRGGAVITLLGIVWTLVSAQQDTSLGKKEYTVSLPATGTLATGTVIIGIGIGLML